MNFKFTLCPLSRRKRGGWGEWEGIATTEGEWEGGAGSRSQKEKKGNQSRNDWEKMMDWARAGRKDHEDGHDLLSQNQKEQAGNHLLVVLEPSRPQMLCVKLTVEICSWEHVQIISRFKGFQGIRGHRVFLEGLRSILYIPFLPAPVLTRTLFAIL
jgi:hypothetical protein